MTLTVSSPVFAEAAEIPRRFTCEGADVSPPLGITGLPAGTAEVALLVEDPDAPGGTFTHWVMWGIGPDRAGIGEGEVPPGAAQGRNDFGQEAYGGPCPPRGRSHRYTFEVLALAEPLGLAPGASAGDLRRAAAGKVLDSGRLTGRYRRH
ncbi:YbhB/YbcL family Raf kinase inhibitor-like protein [Dactylosporangium roseum]|uniref:YbhB/YbcL family Raf kinase inhibitor-like protein n=1 Tax=Dactylosporangium roseum TaxID=47989 RepID=A0ABY5Z9V5_9ACTN|nr:YbhB/YbcL family Raf kinase inhibitor-like protein [Dactylosporangium roseum]UWZ38890.1 YbhB/YbcL family Raf kinase inhibitor-like protein [Dactylosporangium roseum]